MLIKGSLAALLIVMVSLFPARWAGAEDTADLIAKGNKFVEKKDYKKALAEYEKAVKKDPSDPKANLLLGLSYANAGDYDKAIQYTQASLKREPSYSGYNNLALIYANRADYAKASQMFEKALSLNPAAFRTWYQAGLTYAAGGDFEKSAEAYKKAVEINPMFVEGYLGLGSALYWAGDRDGAMAQVIELRKRNENDKAATLESWIQNKERKKTEGAAPATPSPAETTPA
jgi:tetratricopeptide (TPR) repeat protein